jgi:hypothetical protein
MIAIAGFVLLALAAYAFAFGATRLLLRRTRWYLYSLEAPWLTGPALLILTISALGYHEPWSLPAWQAWAALLGGFALSIGVAIWDRVELAALVRLRGAQFCLIVGPACVAAGVLIALAPGDLWDTVVVPWVGELTNYAELAAVLTGRCQGEPGPASSEFVRQHHMHRYGQDIAVAAVAQVADLHPMQVVGPLCIFFRFQMAVATGLLVFELLPRRRQWKWALLVLLLDGVLMVEALFFSSTFLSSNCTGPLFAVYLAWLATQQRFGPAECGLIVLMNLFFLLTYPEFLVVAKGFEALAIAVACWRGNGSTWAPLVACNLALVLLHPGLIAARAESATATTTGNDGWDLLGNPKSEPLRVLNHLTGLRRPHSMIALPRRLETVGQVAVPLVMLNVVAGLVLLGRRYGTTIFLYAWLGLIVLLAVRCALTGLPYYGPAKLLAHTYFVGVLACAVPFAIGGGWRRCWAGAVVLLWLYVAASFTYRYATHGPDVGATLEYSELRETLGAQDRSRPVAVVSRYEQPLALANLAAGETGVPLVPLTARQHYELHMHGVSRCSGGVPRAADGTCHDGLVLCERETLTTGRIALEGASYRVDCRRVVRQIGDFVLCEARVMTSQ